MNKYLKKLNRQESRFTEEFIKHGDRILAFKKAYPNVNVNEDKIYYLATTLIKAAHIKEELKQYLTDSEIKYGLSKSMLIRELKNIAFFDIKEIFDDNGNVRSAKELQQAGRVISEMLVATNINDDGSTTTSRKLKLSNKLTAIDMLNKMMGYYAPEEHRIVDEHGKDVQPTLTVVFQKFGSSDEAHRELPNIEDAQDIIDSGPAPTQ